MFPFNKYVLNRDYYLDRNLNKYFPIQGSYLDFKYNNGVLWNKDQINCKVYFYSTDDGGVDLSDTWMIEYTNLETNYYTSRFMNARRILVPKIKEE